MSTQRTPSVEPDWSLAEIVVLSESETAEQLATAVGLPPDDAWTKGEPKKTSPLRYKISGVSYRSRLPDTAQPDAHLDDLLARLAPVKDRLAVLSARLNADGGRPDALRVWVTQLTSHGSPAYDFTPEQLACISEFGARLGVSVTVLPDADEDGP